MAGLVLTATPSNAQIEARASNKTQVISVEPLGLFQDGNFLSVVYEWKASSTNSYFLRARLSNISYYTGLGIGGGYRWYIADSRALTGLSVAPVAEMVFYSSSELNKSSFVFGIGGEIAYKWIFDQFAVEPGFGVTIGFGGDNVAYYTKTRPYALVNVGYAF
jgi:hypothetical protein